MQATTERDLIQLSQFAADDVLLVQGGGGNTSVKSADGATMWIKASGLRLSEVGPRRGYLETDLPAVLNGLRDEALAALPRAQAHEESVRRIQRAVRGNGSLRPSLETTFHAVLGAAVLHTHPVYVNAFTCMQDGEAALAEAVGEPGLWVRYEPPGFALGREVDRAVRDFRAAKMRLPGHVMLSNHGIIASGDSPAEACETTRRYVGTGKRYFGPLPDNACDLTVPGAAVGRWAMALQRAWHKREGGLGQMVRASRRAALIQAAADPDTWLTGGPLVPDDVVYIGPQIFHAAETDEPAGWLDREVQGLPERLTIAVRGLGVVLAGPSPRTVEAMEENLLAHVLIRWLIAARRGQARPLPPEEVAYLLAMESEKYRQAVVAAGGER